MFSAQVSTPLFRSRGKKSLFWRSVFAPCELESDKRTPRPEVSAFQSFLSEGESKSARCDDLESLKNRNCPTASIENPRGRVVIDKDKPVTNRKDEPGKLKPEQITQIQPQKLTLTLRSGKQLVPEETQVQTRWTSCLLVPAGEPQTFQLKFKRAEDYPIDLYYLMDLSYSMKDDLENVKNLGTALMKEMQKITSDFRIGEDEPRPSPQGWER